MLPTCPSWCRIIIALTLQPGTYLHDRYRIVRRIGKGGMGAVYEAVDTRLRNTVAVKQLEIGGAAANRAFEREAQLLAGLRHPVLPVVIDFFADADEHYFVMQYIEGEDFAHYLAQRFSACPEDEVVAVARAVLDALEYLHAHSPPIVHRDIKPANLKRTPAGDIVLLDFGLAKGRLDHDPTVQREARSLYGFTLQYAPPEQIEGRPTDARSDLFALGATLYHLAAGVAPPTALERAVAMRSGLPDPLVAANVANPAIGAIVAAALSRALQIAPDDRFASAAEMRAALSALAQPAPQRPDPATVERRVDAALPSEVEVGRQTDLIVQVRFATSPLLGIEDWPTARKPEALDRRSEPLQVTHPVDPATGRLAPARVRIKIVASDFAIEGDADRLIEVPVDDYSKRIAFLLTPRRAGYCRVNVEVYALDAVYLGAVAVEANATGEPVAEPVLSVANMILGAFARQLAAAASPTTAIAPKPTISTTADTVRVRVADVAAAVEVEGRRVAEARSAPPVLSQPIASPPPVAMANAKPSLAGRLSVVGGAAAAVLVAAVIVTTWINRRGDHAAQVATAVTTPPAAAGPPATATPPASVAPAAPAASPPQTPAEAPRASRREETRLAEAAPLPAPAPSGASRPRPEPPAPSAAPPAASVSASPPPPRAAAPDLDAQLEAARRQEAAGDLPEALASFERIRRLAPDNPDAEAAILRLRSRMKREGDAAWRNARQYDALGRFDDAAKWYEQAAKLLPDDDPNKKIAKERLDALRARK